MSLLFLTDERFLDHTPGKKHPECPARLEAVWRGLDRINLDDDLKIDEMSVFKSLTNPIE